MALSKINTKLSKIFFEMIHTWSIQTDDFWKVAVGALASFIDASHPKREGAPCWQVNHIVITVCHSCGHDQPVGLTCG